MQRKNGHAGVIELSASVRVNSKGAASSGRWRFEVTSGKRDFMLAADTEEERTRWLAMLQLCVDTAPTASRQKAAPKPASNIHRAGSLEESLESAGLL